MAADAAETAALYSFAGPLRAPRVSWTYRVSLVLVAIAMLLLPLVYAALVAASAWSVWYHLTRHFWLLQGRSSAFAVMAYLLPGAAGIAVTFFLIKPIFARPGRPAPAIALAPDDEPELFAFIDQICRLVGAPKPAAVHADCQVNASAGFAGGVSSLIQRRLVLTIGLPLAAGLSVRELAGVLAHELGHFAQGSGLRLTTLIRGVNAWFSRVVHERDTWDARLEKWSRTGNIRMQMVLRMCGLFVWLSRRLLEGLMMTGRAISGLLSRQMEFDADRYQLRMVGGDAFARTMRRLRELRLAEPASWRDVNQRFGQGQLPLDVTECLMQQLAMLSVEARAAAAAMPRQKARYVDTHPPDAARHAAAMAAADAGILIGGAEPASSLFRSFPGLAERATRHHYEQRRGIGLTRSAGPRSPGASP